MDNSKDRRVMDNYLNSIMEVYEWIKSKAESKTLVSYLNDNEDQDMKRTLSTINRYLILPYLKLKTDEEKKEFEQNNPEIKEVIEIKKKIDNIKKNMDSNYKDRWLNKDGTESIELYEKISEENNISNIFNNSGIEKTKIQKETKSNEERQKPLRNDKTPKYLLNARKIKQWMEKNNTRIPPNSKSNDNEERELGKILLNLRRTVVNPYLLLEENGRKRYKNRYPYKKEVIEIIEDIDKNDLSNELIAMESIEQWMEKNYTRIPPSIESEDKEEMELSNALNRIKDKLIQPYLNLKTEKQKKKYEQMHPKLKKIMRRVKNIERISKSVYVVNAKEIKNWMDENNTNQVPSATSEDDKEKILAKKFKKIKKGLINPYLRLETEELQRKYKSDHPQFQEVMKIIGELIDTKQEELIDTKKDIKQEELIDTKKDIKQEKLIDTKKDIYQAMDVIVNRLVKPYLNLKTEEERRDYKQKYPELLVVMNLGNEIANVGNKKQEVLLQLIEEDTKKRKKLIDAKKIEKSYEERLPEKNPYNKNNKRGTEINE